MPPPSAQQAAAIPDPLTLTIDGVRYGGWKEARISRGIERFPSDFEFALAERLPGEELRKFEPGKTVEVRAGPDLLVTGYIDRVGHRLSANDHTLALAGRRPDQRSSAAVARVAGAGGGTPSPLRCEFRNRIVHSYRSRAAAAASQASRPVSANSFPWATGLRRRFSTNRMSAPMRSAIGANAGWATARARFSENISTLH